MEIHYLKSVLTENGIYADFSHGKKDIEHLKHKREMAHIHDYCEIYFNISGDVSFAVENNIYSISSGDMIITKPNEVHYCIYNSDSRHEHYCLWVDASGEFKYLLSPFYEHKNGENNRISLDDTAKVELIGYFEALIAERADNGKRSVKSAAAILNILNLLDGSKYNTADSLKLPDNLKEILKFIDSHFAQGCNIGNVCNECFISRSSLGRLFKNYLNTTPTRYIESKRLALAKQLLKEDNSVQQVFEKCGFPDYSHFIAIFKRRFGITPLQYKKNRKNK